MAAGYHSGAAADRVEGAAFTLGALMTTGCWGKPLEAWNTISSSSLSTFSAASTATISSISAVGELDLLDSESPEDSDDEGGALDLDRTAVPQGLGVLVCKAAFQTVLVETIPVVTSLTVA